MTQLVATGEHDLIVDGYIHNAVVMKEKGAPIEFVAFNPTMLMPANIIGIMSSSANPHAAAFFVVVVVRRLQFVQGSERDHGQESGSVDASQRCAMDRRTARGIARCFSFRMGKKIEATR